MNALSRRFMQLDLRGKFTVILLAMASAMGAAVFLIVGMVTRHLVIEHGQEMHLVEFMLPLFAGIGVVVVVVLIFIAHFAARILSVPLQQVVAAAEDIAAKGRPDARLPVRGQDEFGRLSAAFNTMVDRLAESYANLEERVAERTREYEESQHEAERASSLLREAVQSIAQGFTIYDENDRLVICNEAYKRFYEESRDLIVPGSSFEEIVRKGAERGQYEAALGNIDEWVRNRVRQHQNANGEIIEQKLGDGRWLLIVEYRTPSGYIVGNRIDITARKHMEEALAETEQRWALAVKGSNDGVWDWNIQTGDLFFSERWKSMLGYADADFQGRLEEWQALLHPEDTERVMAEVQRHLSGATDFYEIEFRLRCKDGSYKWIRARGKAHFDAAGKPVRMTGSHTDISERREAEARVRDRTEQLNVIFDLSPDGFVSFDRDHRVKYATPAFLHITGLGEREIVGLDEQAFSDKLAQLCIEQARFPGVHVLRNRQKVGAGRMAKEVGGSRQLIELAGAGKRVLEVGLRESQAETVSQILYFRDVTHETEVDRLKSEFLSTAAHELRTPMASIFGFTELLLTQSFDEESRREFLTTIFKQSELMVSIINELLDLARIEARRGKDFKFERVDACALVQEIVTGFKTPAGRAGPVVPVMNQPCWVRADRKKLTQAIVNVLSNAYKYSPGGGVVEFDFVPPASGDGEGAGLFGIRVRDHGIGMTNEQVARVCERFYRVDTSGKIPGTGLGMSIVKEIVQLHGGELGVESKVGQGTTVTLWLPLVPASGI